MGAARLLAAAEQAGVIDWAVAVDFTVARARQHATNVARDTGDWVELHESTHRDACPRYRSPPRWMTSKTHHLVDGAGRPLVVLISVGYANDAQQPWGL